MEEPVVQHDAIRHHQPSNRRIQAQPVPQRAPSHPPQQQLRLARDRSRILHVRVRVQQLLTLAAELAQNPGSHLLRLGAQLLRLLEGVGGLIQLA